MPKTNMPNPVAVCISMMRPMSAAGKYHDSSGRVMMPKTALPREPAA